MATTKRSTIHRSAFASERERVLYSARHALDQWCAAVRSTLLGHQGHLPERLREQLRTAAVTIYFSPTTDEFSLARCLAIVEQTSLLVSEKDDEAYGGMLPSYAKFEVQPKILEAIDVLRQNQAPPDGGGAHH